VQFVNRERDIQFGSGIQKIVCKECNIPTTEQQEYWNTCGSDEVLEVLARRRQAVTTSLKARFRSKYEFFLDVAVVCAKCVYHLLTSCTYRHIYHRAGAEG
jgi:hypothetical protein